MLFFAFAGALMSFVGVFVQKQFRCHKNLDLDIDPNWILIHQQPGSGSVFSESGFETLRVQAPQYILLYTVQALLEENPAKHPIIILKDVPFLHLTAILEFMYAGEVNVAQGCVASSSFGMIDLLFFLVICNFSAVQYRYMHYRQFCASESGLCLQMYVFRPISCLKYSTVSEAEDAGIES
jgi:hypothetical protein